MHKIKTKEKSGTGEVTGSDVRFDEFCRMLEENILRNTGCLTEKWPKYVALAGHWQHSMQMEK